MAIESNIIFTIGSKLGPGGFASLKAGIDMVVSMAKSVIELTEELDRTAQAWNRTNKQAVMMADSAAAGLIDTNKIVQQYNVLMQAGVKITDEQFRTLAARSVELAQATGQDATQAFERLTNAIRSGSTEAFREYGVNLKQSTKLSDTHKNAIEALTKGHEDLTAEAETSTERITALGNNLGTMATIMWSATGANDTVAFALDEVNEALETFNNELAESPKRMKEFVESGKFMTGFIAEYKIALLDLATSKFIELERGEKEPSGLLGNLVSLFLPSQEKIKGKGWLEQKVDDLKDSLARTSREALDFYENLDIEEDPATGTGRRRVREAGGEKAVFDEGQGFLQQDLEQSRQLEEYITEQNNRRLDERRAMIEQEREAEFLRIQESTEWQTEYFNYLDELEEEASFKKQNRFAVMLGVEKRYVDASRKQWESGLQGKAQMMGTFFGSVAQLMNTESEKMFKIGKAAAIAEAFVNTYLGAVKAYQAMAGIPYVGPALGAAAAAAIVAAGMASIAQIRRQQFQGGGGSATAISSPSASQPSRGLNLVGASGVGGVPAGAAQQAGGMQELNVSITLKDGAGGLFDVVMEQNDSSDRDGRRSFATTRAA
jgi:hypothetical protein